MVDAYRDPFDDSSPIETIELDNGAIYPAGPEVPVDFSAPAEVIVAQFYRWRKPQGPDQS